MAVTTVILASADSRLLNTSPDTNFAAEPTFQVGSTGGGTPDINRGIIRFPLTAPAQPVGRLLAVNLFFRQSVGAALSDRASVHNVTLPGINFVESEVTWNDIASGNPWGSNGGDFDNVELIEFFLATGAQDHNLDALAMWNEQIVARGQSVFSVILKRDSEDSDDTTGTFDSRENLLFRPVLTLTHAPALNRLRPQMLTRYDRRIVG